MIVKKSIDSVLLDMFGVVVNLQYLLLCAEYIDFG